MDIDTSNSPNKKSVGSGLSVKYYIPSESKRSPTHVAKIKITMLNLTEPTLMLEYKF